MKGVIVNCLEEMVTKRFGKDKWLAALSGAGVKKGTVILATADVDDKIVLAIIGELCKLLSITLQDAADAFGEYWVCEFAPKVYPAVYANKRNAKEFLLAMDQVHLDSTKNIANARPPRFDYQWEDDKTLIMTYKSNRGLMEFFIGLVKGVGKYYLEELKIEQRGNNQLKITFP